VANCTHPDTHGGVCPTCGHGLVPRKREPWWKTVLFIALVIFFFFVLMTVIGVLSGGQPPSG
jgi:hypothetical protein